MNPFTFIQLCSMQGVTHAKLIHIFFIIDAMHKAVYITCCSLQILSFMNGPTDLSTQHSTECSMS